EELKVPSLSRRILKPLLPPILVQAARTLFKAAGRRRAETPPPVADAPAALPAVVPAAERPVPEPGPAAAPPRPEWECIPQGFAADDPLIQGWDVPSIVETQKAKWSRFRRLLQGPVPLGVAHEAPVPSADDFGAHNTLMAFAYVLTLAARCRDRLSVLDWGSGLGHYYHFGRALLPEVRLDYHARDLPLLCRPGRELSPE